MRVISELTIGNQIDISSKKYAPHNPNKNKNIINSTKSNSILIKKGGN